MDWIITESNMLSPQDIDRQGNKLLVGNGYIGYRGTLDEFDKAQKTATIVSGLYDQVGDQWREPVNLPNGGFVQVFYQGEPLHALQSEILEHTQSLDMQHAIHERRTVFAAGDGANITVRARRFASLAQPHLICLEYSVSADRPCEIEVVTGIDGDVWDINGPHLQEIVTSETGGLLTLSACTHENDVPLVVSEALAFTPGSPPMTLSPLQEPRKYCAFRKLHADLAQGELTFYKFIAHFTRLDGPDPLEASRSLCQQAVVLGFAALLQAHSTLWEQRWETCDIQIEGDAPAQQALRFSMYHLLAIAPTHSEFASIPARGLSGQVYKGAIFWDTEIFMLPFFSHAFPELARNLLLYRYHTLVGARRKAGEYGFRGAFYAWESQDEGKEACTLFNITDVFTNRPLRTYFRDKQVHISGDVAYAFWQYYKTTGDASIWRDGGAEVVFECARFYLSYVYYNLDKRRYEVLDVTGPDEYHERVHNKAFTNRLVAHTLEICMQVAAYLQQTHPDYYAALVDRLDFEQDLKSIAEVAQQFFLPDQVPPGAIIPQFDGYFKLEDLPLKALLAKKLDPNEYLGGGNGLATTTQILKQADVVLTLFLFNDRYPLQTRTANWEFYEPRTEHGSSLSACSYSLIAAQIGRVDWAYKYFMKTATIDLTGEGKQYVGTLYIGGTHPAGNGGAWMAAVFGLCGIQGAGEILKIQPHLPSHWKKVTLSLVFRGQKLKITLTSGSVTVQPAIALASPLSISVGDSTLPLPETGEVSLPVG
jgi:nigerose phosphorylase